MRLNTHETEWTAAPCDYNFLWHHGIMLWYRVAMTKTMYQVRQGYGNCPWHDSLFETHTPTKWERERINKQMPWKREAPPTTHRRVEGSLVDISKLSLSNSLLQQHLTGRDGLTQHLSVWLSHLSIVISCGRRSTCYYCMTNNITHTVWIWSSV